LTSTRGRRRFVGPGAVHHERPCAPRPGCLPWPPPCRTVSTRTNVRNLCPTSEAATRASGSSALDAANPIAQFAAGTCVVPPALTTPRGMELDPGESPGQGDQTPSHSPILRKRRRAGTAARRLVDPMRSHEGPATMAFGRHARALPGRSATFSYAGPSRPALSRPGSNHSPYLPSPEGRRDRSGRVARRGGGSPPDPKARPWPHFARVVSVSRSSRSREFERAGRASVCVPANAGRASHHAASARISAPHTRSMDFPLETCSSTKEMQVFPTFCHNPIAEMRRMAADPSGFPGPVAVFFSSGEEEKRVCISKKKHPILATQHG